MNDSSHRTPDAELSRLTLRRAHGEATAEELRRLDARLQAEPQWVAAVQRLEASWQQLEPPAASPVPVGFSTRVVARARALRRGEDGFSWKLAPTWLRAAAAAALVTGVALGAGVGTLVAEPSQTESWGLEQPMQLSTTLWTADADDETVLPWESGAGTADEETPE